MTKNKFIFGILLVFSLILVAGLTSANCVGATYNFTCEEQVNESCTFDGDMDCSGAAGGLVVTSSDIEINCDGYTLTGNYGSYGISTDGVDLVVIHKCNLDTWMVGIYVPQSNETEIYDNTITNVSDSGIMTLGLGGEGYSYIYNNEIECNYNGTVSGIADSSVGGYDVIDNNDITDCYMGINVQSTNHINITNNEVYKVLEVNDGTQDTGIRLDYSNDDYIYNNTIYGFNNRSMMQTDKCIWLENAINNEITNNTLSDCYRGIHVDSGISNMIQFNQIGGTHETGCSTGVRLEDGQGNVVWKNNITHICDGVFIDGEIWDEISHNWITDGANIPYGLEIYDLFSSSIVNNYIDGMDGNGGIGIMMQIVTNVIFTGNNVSGGSPIGWEFTDVSFSTCDSNSIKETITYDAYFDTVSATCTNLETDHATIDTIYFTDIAFKDTTSYPVNTGHSPLVVYNVTNTSAGGSVMELNISYSPSVDESTLLMWKYHNSTTGWESIPNSTDTINDIVFTGSITEFSYFAPMGDLAYIGSASCGMLNLLLILCCLAIVAVALVLIWFYRKNGTITTAQVVFSFILIMILIALVSEIANQVAGVCS